REHQAQQLDFRKGVRVEEGLRDAGRLDSSTHKLGGDLQGALGRVREVEASRVRQQSGVDALGDFFCNLYSQRFAKIVNHLTDCGRCRVHPIDVTERRRVGMMVDVYDKLALQSG